MNLFHCMCHVTCVISYRREYSAGLRKFIAALLSVDPSARPSVVDCFRHSVIAKHASNFMFKFATARANQVVCSGV